MITSSPWVRPAAAASAVPSDVTPVALVTGATGGLGRHISLHLAKEGYRLFLHGRDITRLETLSAEVRALGGTSPYLLAADFRDLGEVAALCEELGDATSRLDLLINNAGAGFEPDASSMCDGIGYTFKVNYLAPYLIMHRLFPMMRVSEDAVIVNVASLGQADLPADLRHAGSGGTAIVYGRSKLALIMATRSLADQAGDRAPAVFALHPGSMLDTNLTQSLLKRMPSWVGFCWRASRRLRPTVAAAAGFVVTVAREGAGGRRSGTFWTVKGPGRARPQAGDPLARARLEAFSREAVEPFLSQPSRYAGLGEDQAEFETGPL